MKLVKIFDGNIINYVLEKCSAGGQSHLGFFILLRNKEFFKKKYKGFRDKTIRHEYTHKYINDYKIKALKNSREIK